jgi:hypothetical protein
MISDAEQVRLRELCAKPPPWGWDEIDALATAAQDYIPALIAEVERLQHENATCASALMIARDARHVAERVCHAHENTIQKLIAGRDAAEAELAALRAENDKLRGEIYG